MARVAEIYRYPVKGLSAEPLKRVALAAGEVIPFDRAYAIENGVSGFDPRAPRHFPKIAFLMLMRNERLAELRTRFDENNQMLTISRDGRIVAEGRLDTIEGRQAIESFFETFAGRELRGLATVISAPGFSFSDTANRVLSLINLASVRDLARTIGADVHPLRFRGNLYVDGLPAWEEFSWVGQRVSANGVVFEATKRIERCAATNVDPVTGVRDLTVPLSLLDAYGHSDCGIYLKVIEAGTIAPGDAIAPA